MGCTNVKEAPKNEPLQKQNPSEIRGNTNSNIKKQPSAISAPGSKIS
jgi:hypothetical protein